MGLLMFICKLKNYVILLVLLFGYKLSYMKVCYKYEFKTIGYVWLIATNKQLDIMIKLVPNVLLSVCG